MPMPLLRTGDKEALADCTAVGWCNLAKCLTQRWSEDDTGCQETCSLADEVDFALVTVRVLTMRCASPPYRESCYHWWAVSISGWNCLPAKKFMRCKLASSNMVYAEAAWRSCYCTLARTSSQTNTDQHHMNPVLRCKPVQGQVRLKVQNAVMRARSGLFSSGQGASRDRQGRRSRRRARARRHKRLRVNEKQASKNAEATEG